MVNEDHRPAREPGRSRPAVDRNGLKMHRW